MSLHRPLLLPAGALSGFSQDIGETLVQVGRLFKLNMMTSYVCQNGNALPHMLSRVSSERYDQVDAARRFYERQRPLVAASAAHFELHPYWAGVGNASNDSFERLIGARAIDMAEQLRTSGRDDFIIEKDKCRMFDYAAAHCLPVS